MSGEESESASDMEDLLQENGTAELVEKLDESSEDIVELIELLQVVQDLSEDLTPEVKEVVYENREEIESLRSAFEKEETLVLLQKLGENSDNVIEMLDMLDAAQAFAEDLTPEVKKVVYENREVIEDLRESLEKEETIELLKKLGENTEGVLMTMELLDGLHDASQEIDAEMYEIGETLGQLFILLDTFKDPATVESFNNALQVFAEPEEKQKDYRLSVLGLLKLPFDKEVRQALGLFVEAARRMVR